jgi:hypothetical protein
MDGGYVKGPERRRLSVNGNIFRARDPIAATFRLFIAYQSQPAYFFRQKGDLIDEGIYCQ